MKKVVLLFLLLAGILILGGCVYGASKAPTPVQNSSVSSNMINIQNFAFSPETLTVKKGTTVIWTNKDNNLHQIKSDTFNSSQLSKGQTFFFTFNDIGTFNYSCAIHPSMTGKIIVE